MVLLLGKACKSVSDTYTLKEGIWQLSHKLLVGGREGQKISTGFLRVSEWIPGVREKHWKVAQWQTTTYVHISVWLRGHLIISQFFSEPNVFRIGGRGSLQDFVWKLTNRTFYRSLAYKLPMSTYNVHKRSSFRSYRCYSMFFRSWIPVT